MGIDAEMFVRTKNKRTPQEVRKLAYKLAAAFGHESFWIWRPGESSFNEEGRHCLEIVEVYEQDGDDIVPEPGEQFIRCYPGTRYFGEGYQRGNIRLLCDIAEWLEGNLGGEVWYGGDSSGVCAEKFDQEARQKHKRLFFESGKTWLLGFSNALGDTPRPTCDFCTVPMTQTTFAGRGNPKANNVFTCLGCGYAVDGEGRAIEEKRVAA
jgi:hypothetical protein